MSRSDKEHLLARAEQERALAVKATDKVVNGIHFKLAHEYEVRAKTGEIAALANDMALENASNKD
jgi:hypothetical protein